MLSKEKFIEFILKGPDEIAENDSKTVTDPALPGDLMGFNSNETQTTPTQPGSFFARRLLEASGFGYPEMVQRNNLIRSSDAVARYLPERVSYWKKTSNRPYQTLLFETELNHKQLLSIPAFKSRKMAHLDIVEDALARLVSEALEGFRRGGEGVTSDVRKGKEEETLCVMSILDEREGDPVRLVCFGTQNQDTGGLETFLITEHTRNWELKIAREHLGLLYERQFSRLEGKKWQESFTTTDERKQAEKLLQICTRKNPRIPDIQEGVLDLLDIIAKGFGLRKPPRKRRLQAFDLPPDHDIAIDSEKIEGSFGGKNPFSGVTLRDEQNRLLGYIVYPLKSKTDATTLRKHLNKNNRFHNVLVVYPDQEQTSLELWQGQTQLTGKLRKGHEYKDAADVVNLLSRFFVVSKAKVKNPTELARELAYRARYLRRLAVRQLEEEQKKGPLRNLYNAFKEALVHDQTEDEFSDAFAQTITYGLLTARWIGNDDLVANGERLTRQTALKYLPPSSPFLNELFKTVLSIKLDEQRGRLLWLVDDITDLLDRIDVTYVFGAGDKDSDTATDPVIHFYEPFLAAYDKDLKNKRGVFFTPRPVVSYIVRSVHELLQKEFGLEDGLASTDTWGDVARRIKGVKTPEGVKASDPFVCILDPATGTGTFLYECIEIIERTMKDRWCRELKKKDWTDPAIIKLWNKYVLKHLLTRLFGYELMMASYAVAHLKLSFKLIASGHSPTRDQRLRVYLTNSLEPASDVGQQKLTGAFPALAHEAAAVNRVKKGKRFTVVIGNPPYSISSANMSVPWILSLIKDYKRGCGVETERRLAPIQDDYIKFIRLSHCLAEQVGCGVIGLITNNSYLDGLIHRAMRQRLLRDFARICIYDLRGSARRGDTANAEVSDENVFDILQGVAVALFVSHPLLRRQHTVEYASLYGPQTTKYAALSSHALASTTLKLLAPVDPYFFFSPKDFSLDAEWQEYVAWGDFFHEFKLGFMSGNDELLTDRDPATLERRMRRVLDPRVDADAIAREFGVRQNHPVSRMRRARFTTQRIIPCSYRLFDTRFAYYDDQVMERALLSINRHLMKRNLALCASRQLSSLPYQHIFVTNQVTEMSLISNKTKEANRVVPLYLYDDGDDLLQSRGEHNRRANITGDVRRRLAARLQTASVDDGRGDLHRTVGPEDIFYYVYAILHSPVFRGRYASYLEIDFPRLPLTSSLDLFRALATLGGELVALHLMESPKLDKHITKWSGGKNPEVEKVTYSDETVWTDKAQSEGFRGVPENVWNFHIGGYQVCHKWLKDRKGRVLSKDDIAHYQKIVVALSETIRIMKEIDKVIEKHGGWPGAFVTKKSGGKK